MSNQDRLTELLGIEVPIIQAPMAGVSTPAMALGVARAGGLGSLAMAALDLAEADQQIAAFRSQTDKPLNINFFCHEPPAAPAAGITRWSRLFSGYRKEFSLRAEDVQKKPLYGAFDKDCLALVERLRPDVVSFHFGLPEAGFVSHIKSIGACVMSSATSVREALWLEANGADVVIAQGLEAGGHRGMFLENDIAQQTGTMALVPQVVDAVCVPVVAAGGIADGRGVAAAMALGASGVQIGTAYLRAEEAALSDVYRRAVAECRSTIVTNVFSGRPARGILNRIVRDIGPINPLAPAFPFAANALQPLRRASEAMGDDAFSAMWCGQGAAMVKPGDSFVITERIATECEAACAALTEGLAFRRRSGKALA